MNLSDREITIKGGKVYELVDVREAVKKIKRKMKEFSSELRGEHIFIDEKFNEIFGSKLTND